MKDEKKQDPNSVRERYERVCQLMKEGKLPTSTDDVSLGISAELLESFKEIPLKKESK